MKLLKYQIVTRSNMGTAGHPNIVRTLSDVTLSWSEANEKLAMRESYNGEYTIEDDGEPEPVIPPTNEELAKENKLLKEQVAALSDQNDFQEELIVELANIVYA